MDIMSEVTSTNREICCFQTLMYHTSTKKHGILRNMYYCFSNTSCIKSVKDSVKDSGTHLWLSVWTDRLWVSSCVSISRVRLGLALWLLQHLGNRRADGGRFCQRLRWHNRNAHWLIARKQSCYSGGATKCFGCESNTKPTNTTKLLKKGNKSIFLFGSLITRQCTKRYTCTQARLKMCMPSQHFERRLFDLDDEQKWTSTQQWNELA